MMEEWKIGIVERWKEKTVSNYSLIAHEDIDSSHSISRNIAEGYSRRSIKEYLNFSKYSIWFKWRISFLHN